MKNNTLRNTYNKYLTAINGTPASQSTADAINKFLPTPMHISRMTTSNWMNKDSADPGIFYALLYHAPEASEEFQFAQNALAALGCLVEAEEKVVS